ncbi:hypothetical protein ACFT7U_11350 [Streptomyces rochei]|uniref:hypothetical protein n=1 Tax=Streptomyces rochei TaxID=1928 RepID=UPI00362ECB77
MDPAIAAALIASPTAVVAAAAAFAAGQAQARGAHRGPVDAVRRQHQRDAYAAHLGALHTYAAATSWEACYSRALENTIMASGVPLSPTAADMVPEGARTLVANVPIAELMRTGAAVELEGPEDIAAAARITMGTARQVKMTARTPFASPNDYVNVVRAHGVLEDAITGFVGAARTHLNGATE